MAGIKKKGNWGGKCMVLHKIHGVEWLSGYFILFDNQQTSRLFYQHSKSDQFNADINKFNKETFVYVVVMFMIQININFVEPFSVDLCTGIIGLWLFYEPHCIN